MEWDEEWDEAERAHDPMCGVEGVYCADCLADQADRADTEREEQQP